MTRFARKTALITGGSRGIGLAVARAILAGGGQVLIADIRDEAGSEAVAQLGPNADFVRLDVTSEAAFCTGSEYCIDGGSTAA